MGEQQPSCDEAIVVETSLFLGRRGLVEEDKQCHYGQNTRSLAPA
jgi:hypothetical protein